MGTPFSESCLSESDCKLWRGSLAAVRATGGRRRARPGELIPIFDFKTASQSRRNFAGLVVFEPAEASRSFDLRARPCLKRQKLGGFDDFSATPAETCAADPKGRRHFLFFS
jgi:hypothetical protein